MDRPDFIKALAADLTPLPPNKTRNELLLALGAGAVVTAAVVLHYGVQPNLLAPAHLFPLLVKSAYGLGLAAIAAVMLWPLLHPGRRAGSAWRLTGVPLLLLAGLTAVELTSRPAGQAAGEFLGASWRWCPFRVAALSVPAFAGLCWAIRRQAPVDLRAAGAVAGLLSGGLAAAFYALACPEPGAGFILIWYTAGIAISAGIGALIGPWVLRW